MNGTRTRAATCSSTVRQRRNRKLYSGGLQTDASYHHNDQTPSLGVTLLDETVSRIRPRPCSDGQHRSRDVQSNGPAFSIVDNHTLHGSFMVCTCRTNGNRAQTDAHYGTRFDVFNSSLRRKSDQPRANLIYQITDTTTLHAGSPGISRRRRLRLCLAQRVNKFDGTSNESPRGPNAPDSPGQSRRAIISTPGSARDLLPPLQWGVDGYYKYAHTTR